MTRLHPQATSSGTMAGDARSISMVAWWWTLVTLAAGVALGWGLAVGVLMWFRFSKVVRSFQEDEAEIERRNDELQQRIKRGCRQVWPPPNI